MKNITDIIDVTDYVTTRIAKELKELGYDGLTNAYCSDSLGSFVVMNEMNRFNSNSMIDTADYHSQRFYMDFDTEKYEEKYAVPTLEQAHKWIRKNYHLYINVVCYTGTDWSFYITVYNDDESMNIDTPETSYMTYEQALNAGIESAIAHIKSNNEQYHER